MTAAPVITLTPAERAALGPIERAALAVGTALVAWSRHAARRAAARAAVRTVAHDISTDIDSQEHELREQHELRRAALRDHASIEAARDPSMLQRWR
jgi:uncharacterized protein (DUF1501 family)